MEINLKKWLRNCFTNILYISGILHLWVRIKLRNKAVVLMYHRVLSDEELSQHCYQTGMAVTIDTFRIQMEYISRHCKPVSLEGFANHLQKNIPFPSKTILITFDDGWRDNFINAYPILKENKIPAVIFLPTDFIGSNRRFWQQELSDLLLAMRQRVLGKEESWHSAVGALDDETISSVITSNEKNLPAALGDCLNGQKKKTIAQIEGLIQSLKETFSNEQQRSDGPDVFLTWDDARTMSRNGIAFGSHGKSHELVTVIEPQEAEREIVESREKIEKELGRPAYALSYPNGNYNDTVLGIVKKQGYRVAFGTAPGVVSSDDNFYSIKRINVHEDMTNTLPMFLARIAGLS